MALGKNIVGSVIKIDKIVLETIGLGQCSWANAEIKQFSFSFQL